MKLRRGRSRYKIPAHSWIESVVIHGGKFQYLAQPVAAEILPKKGIHSLPTSWTIDRGLIRFWPVPDHAYRATIVYAPPLKEF